MVVRVSRGSLIPTEEESGGGSASSARNDRSVLGTVGRVKLTLKDRDLQIFLDRIVSESPLTLQEIGDRYNISRETELRQKYLES